MCSTLTSSFQWYFSTVEGYMHAIVAIDNVGNAKSYYFEKVAQFIFATGPNAGVNYKVLTEDDKLWHISHTCPHCPQ